MPDCSARVAEAVVGFSIRGDESTYDGEIPWNGRMVGV